ncbi:RING/U-box superfamily protein [Striga asiatica]|uniref:RING/U-box superfamily protein n=1 Tax=Striga asiatica TaxID=4170 RepID=A0A5A7PHW4_STRAF|nr:RING/U-box superfamily protein [Striga asiatica]
MDQNMESKEVHSTSKSSDDQTQSGPIEGDCLITREAAIEISLSEMTGGGPIECSITQEDAVAVEISPPSAVWGRGEILVVNFITKNKDERHLGTIPKMEAICTVCCSFVMKYTVAFKTKCKCEMSLVHEECVSEGEEKGSCGVCDDKIVQYMPVILSLKGKTDPLAVIESDPEAAEEQYGEYLKL